MIPATLLSLLATLGSMLSLTGLSVITHSLTAPKSLSERVAQEDKLLARFRNTLLLCSAPFAVAIYFFIAPSARLGWWIAGAWTLEHFGVILAAVLPARGKTFYPHLVAAQSMALGMLLLAFAFWRNYSGVGASIELALFVVMATLAVLSFVDTRRYIYHELSFIYLSHVSIVVAALLTA